MSGPSQTFAWCSDHVTYVHTVFLYNVQQLKNVLHRNETFYIEMKRSTQKWNVLHREEKRFTQRRKKVEKTIENTVFTHSLIQMFDYACKI